MEQTIQYKNWLEYIKDISRKSSVLLIYSPTTIKLALNQEELKIEGVTCISSHVPFDDLSVTFLYESANAVEPFQICVGIGGGAAIDRAKYLANLLHIPCVAIPSMLSTNVFATDKVAYIDSDNNKKTIPSVLPEVIIYDDELLKPHDVHSIYGLADAISILTALKDWDIADRDCVESISEEYYIKATRILSKAKRFIAKSRFDNIDIFMLLLAAGHITNEYGTGRPESGSEHILAKIVESKIDIPHAVAVSFSMLIVSQFHKCFEEVADLVEKLGIFTEIVTIPYGILRDSILELEPRDDRYSIIDTLDEISVSDADCLLNRMYKRFNVGANSIILDLDGVLWDATEEVSKVYQKHLNRTNIDVKKFMGKTSQEIADELNISLEELLDIQADEVKHLWNNPGKLYPLVAITLRVLKNAGRDLFIVSNCQRGYINTFLEACGVTNLITDWRCGHDSDEEDSKEDNIRYLCDRYNLIYPIYVGDTESDWHSATKAGVNFIAADYGFGSIPEFVKLRISNFGDLVKLLEEKYEYTTR